MGSVSLQAGTSSNSDPQLDPKRIKLDSRGTTSSRAGRPSEDGLSPAAAPGSGQNPLSSESRGGCRTWSGNRVFSGCGWLSHFHRPALRKNDWGGSWESPEVPGGQSTSRWLCGSQDSLD